jgi:hypothetical protein
VPIGDLDRMEVDDDEAGKVAEEQLYLQGTKIRWAVKAKS